jgi:hypothetical protein
MVIEIIDRKDDLKKRNILWVEPSHFRLDESLHKMADLEISKQLGKRKISTYLLVIRSKKFVLLNLGTSRVCTISVPIKYVPLLSSVMYAAALLFYLPLYIIKLSPSVVMVAPDVSIVSCIPALFFSKFKCTKFVLDVRSVPVELAGFRGFLQKFWFSTSILVARQLFDGMTGAVAVNVSYKNIVGSIDAGAAFTVSIPVLFSFQVEVSSLRFNS